jgi:hypothetical protein
MRAPVDSVWEPRDLAGKTVPNPEDVHACPQSIHMSEGPDTLGERHGFPVFPSPYYY